jgi:hypothetical protein
VRRLEPCIRPTPDALLDEPPQPQVVIKRSAVSLTHGRIRHSLALSRFSPSYSGRNLR